MGMPSASDQFREASDKLRRLQATAAGPPALKDTITVGLLERKSCSVVIAAWCCGQCAASACAFMAVAAWAWGRGQGHDHRGFLKRKSCTSCIVVTAVRCFGRVLRTMHEHGRDRERGSCVAATMALILASSPAHIAVFSVSTRLRSFSCTSTAGVAASATIMLYTG
jgi:hypothetical protein